MPPGPLGGAPRGSRGPVDDDHPKDPREPKPPRAPRSPPAEPTDNAEPRRRALLVTDHPAVWLTAAPPGVEVVDARAYVAGEPPHLGHRRARVYNLCRSYRYQGIGYHVSLLAEARGQKVLPDPRTLRDLVTRSLVKAAAAADHPLEPHLRRAFARVEQNHVELTVVFGRSLDGRYSAVASRVFRLFPAPFMRLQFQRSGPGAPWALERAQVIPLDALADDQLPEVFRLVGAFFARPGLTAVTRREDVFDLAILHDPGEPEPPSDARALQRFTEAARGIGLATELIERADYGRLAQFDGLFIRATTRVDHYTYRFARRAVALGLVVMDDPGSILRCTNKVFLAELLTRHGVPTPRTLVVHRSNADVVPEELGFPCVLKLPDSSFSQGVHRADDRDGYKERIRQLFRKSDLIIAQEFLPTDYDWRIGVLGGVPLYACRYHMAKGHWQVIRRDPAGAKLRDGDSDTLPVEDAPRAVVDLAVRAAGLVGDGLYGVDLKVVDGDRVVVIEVNDNPNLDAGVEDAVLGPALYSRIAELFLARITALRGLERRS